MPVDTATGACIVTALMDGVPARMMLDTGAERTIVTAAAVVRRRMRLDEWVGTAMRGAGGRLDEHQNAMVNRLSLGDTPLLQRGTRDGLSLPVTSLDLGGLDGLIGGDVLRRFALDVDMPAARMALLATAAPGGSVVALQLLRRALPLAPVRLDGVSLVALVDTGAAVSLVNARGMFKLGLSGSARAADQVGSALGIGGSFSARRHRFETLMLGDRRFQAPALLVVATPEPAFDLVLGMDLLGRQRFMLSYPEQRLRMMPDA